MRLSYAKRVTEYKLEIMLSLGTDSDIFKCGVVPEFDFIVLLKMVLKLNNIIPNLNI